MHVRGRVLQSEALDKQALVATGVRKKFGAVKVGDNAGETDACIGTRTRVLARK